MRSMDAGKVFAIVGVVFLGMHSSQGAVSAGRAGGGFRGAPSGIGGAPGCAPGGIPGNGIHGNGGANWNAGPVVTGAPGVGSPATCGGNWSPPSVWGNVSPPSTWGNVSPPSVWGNASPRHDGHGFNGHGGSRFSHGGPFVGGVPFGNPGNVFVGPFGGDGNPGFDGVIQGFAPNPVQGFDPEPVSGLTPEPVTGFNPEPVTGFSPEPVSGLDPNPVTGFVPQPIQGFTGGIDTRKQCFTGQPSRCPLCGKMSGQTASFPNIVRRQPDRPLSTVDLSAALIEWAGIRIERSPAPSSSPTPDALRPEPEPRR